MSRDIPFDENAICESCGKKGAYDFMGDELCMDCAFREGWAGVEKGDAGK